MLKSVFVLFLFGVCLGAPPTPLPANSPEVVPIVSQHSDVQLDGYTFGFESGDGTVQEQKGVIKTVDKESVIDVEGKYSYTDKDGVAHSVTYTADENGFHAEGDTLPVAPPIPEAIARALKYNEEHPYVEEKVKPKIRKGKEIPEVEVVE